MATAISRRPNQSALAFLLVGAGVVLVIAILATRGYPRRDSGIFLYVGQQILEGSIPYRDIWDNKPPGVFYMDALGLLLGGGSVAGVWVLEYACLSASVILGMKTMIRAFGLGGAFFGSATWLIGLMVFSVSEGLNFTEEYAIPLKFAAFWLFLKAEERGYRGRWGLLLGATAALALLLRQNLIGIHLAIAAYMLVTRWRRRQGRRLLSEALWVVAGVVAVIAPVFAYFAANNGLDDMVEVAFLYNLLYSTAPVLKRLSSIAAGLEWLSASGLGVIAIAAWLTGLALLVIGGRLKSDAWRLITLCLIAFPVELLLAGTSIRAYGHYYEAWLPVAAILAGFFASYSLSGGDRDPGNALRHRPVIWQVSLLLAMTLMPLYGVLQRAMPIDRSVPVINQVAEYVRDNTDPDDHVLVWGADSSISFLSDRRSPSRFFHQYPLFTRGYETPEMVTAFLTDLKERPPVLIVDTSPVNSHVPPIDSGRRQTEGWTRWGPEGIYASSANTDRMFAFLNANYREIDPLVGPGGTVYLYERVPRVGNSRVEVWGPGT